jgi:hypothetical protein
MAHYCCATSTRRARGGHYVPLRSPSRAQRGKAARPRIVVQPAQWGLSGPKRTPLDAEDCLRSRRALLGHTGQRSREVGRGQGVGEASPAAALRARGVETVEIRPGPTGHECIAARHGPRNGVRPPCSGGAAAPRACGAERRRACPWAGPRRPTIAPAYRRYKNQGLMYSTIKVRERHPRPHHEGATVFARG